MPISVSDITVSPGDCVIADGSAVVFIAAADLPQMLDTAEAIAAREAAIAEAVRSGKSVAEVMGAGYERMLQRPASSS